MKAVPEGKVGEPGGTLMYVTALRVIYRPLPDDDLELVVVDAESGHPVPDAEVVIYTGTDGRFMPSQTYTADKEGTLKLGFPDKKRTIMYNARTIRLCRLQTCGNKSITLLRRIANRRC